MEGVSESGDPSEEMYVRRGMPYPSSTPSSVRVVEDLKLDRLRRKKMKMARRRSRIREAVPISA